MQGDFLYTIYVKIFAIFSDIVQMLYRTAMIFFQVEMIQNMSDAVEEDDSMFLKIRLAKQPYYCHTCPFGINIHK